MARSDEVQRQALEVAKLWWLPVLVGAVSLCAGCILIAQPSHSLAALAVVFGIFLLIDGIVEVVRSFGHEVDSRAVAAILGVLAIIVGVALIRHPFHGVAAIGLLIGIWLIAAGVFRLLRAVTAAAHPWLQALIAVLEVVVGIVVVSNPHIGYTTLAIILGIWLLINGVATIALGFVIRRAKKELESPSASPVGATG